MMVCRIVGNWAPRPPSLGRAAPGRPGCQWDPARRRLAGAGPGASGITVTDSLAGSMIVMTGPVREPTQARAVRLGDRTAAGSEPSGNGGSLNGQESQDLQLDSE